MTPDPFEDFLEDALGAPEDLELGHMMRRRLLQAAAAVADDSQAPSNVVALDRRDPDEAEGFAWLVGEAPASTQLMIRMVADPVFLEALDGERCFLRTLRTSLRRAAATAAPARRRWLPVGIAAAAAAIALAAGMSFRPAAPESGAVLAAAAGEAPAAGSGAPKASVAGPVKAIVALRDQDRDAGEARPFEPEEIPAAPAELADLSGSGQAIDPGDPLMGAQLPAVLALAAAEDVVPEPVLVALGGSPEMFSESGSESGQPLMAMADFGSPSGLGGSGGLGQMGGMNSIGPSLTGPGRGTGGGKEGTIPEPGGALPVMIGFLVLLLRRPRRQKAQG